MGDAVTGDHEAYAVVAAPAMHENRRVRGIFEKAYNGGDLFIFRLLIPESRIWIRRANGSPGRAANAAPGRRFARNNPAVPPCTGAVQSRRACASRSRKRTI